MSDGEENVPSERGEFQEQASYQVYVEAEREAAEEAAAAAIVPEEV